MDGDDIRLICNNRRCGFAVQGYTEVQAGNICPVCCGGKMRRDRCMPWDEPSRLAFYGVDPGGYGNAERRSRCT